jgi:mono/diheme cytochrome c family protein
MRKRIWISAPALILVAVALAGWRSAVREGPAGTAPAPPQAAAERVAAGKLSYDVYCASCHGRSARGNGPVAEFLRIAPADLTRLAARHGGTFPADDVAATIDGRREVRVHGPSEMPVWGLSLAVSGRDATREDDVREQIRDLVLYLESVQEPPPRR